MTKKRKVPAVIWREGDWYVAKTLGIELSSQGRTKKLALKNLQEALDLVLEDEGIQMQASVLPQNPELKQVYA